MIDTRPYSIWRNLLQRISNPKSPSYKYYGGRGITVCEEWRTFKGFWEDMEDGYGNNLTIDRIDVNGNYEPSNCRWVTKKTQQENRTGSIFYKGEHTVNAATRLGLSKSAIRHRIKNGWPIDAAFTEPAKPNGRHRLLTIKRGKDE